MWLKIANVGEMESGALTLLGGSTKRGDSSKIGMFGSGNKYALAYLLRNNIGVRIYSGLEEIKVSVVNEEFRGGSFGVIHINGKPTSITTGSGPDWVFWHVIREIYSNAIDEGLIEMRMEEELFPIIGETHFYLKVTPEVNDFFTNLNKYFSEKREYFYKGSTGKAFRKISDRFIVYRKGIRCYENYYRSLFDYEFNDIDISETRVANYGQVISKIAELIMYSDNDTIIETYYKNSRNFDFIENRFEGYTSIFSENISDKWKKLMPKKYLAYPAQLMVLEDNEVEECQVVNVHFYEWMVDRFRDEIVHPVFRNEKTKGYRVLEKTAKEELLIKKAYDFLNECKFKFDFIENIEVVNFTSKKSYSIKKDQKALIISRHHIDKGLNNLINLIVLANMEIKANISGDYTEDTCIEYLVNYMADQNAIIL